MARRRADGFGQNQKDREKTSGQTRRVKAVLRAVLPLEVASVDFDQVYAPGSTRLPSARERVWSE
jgi:hypothetical protein